MNPTLLKSVLLLSLLAWSPNALAYRPIIRDFHSARTAGMGDVRYTVGQYEENFFANPARSADNEGFLLQLPKLTLEMGSGTMGSISKLVNSGNSGLGALSSVVGEPLYARFQLIPFAVHFKNFISDKWSFGAGIFVSAQTISVLSQSGQIDPTTAISGGPVLNLSRRLLEEDRLVVGMNLRTEARASSKSQFSIQDFLTGTNVSQAVKGGSGFGLDFDLGATFRPHWNAGGFDYQLGFAINNLLGGEYKNLGKPISTWAEGPYATPTTFNFGVSATRKDLWKLDHLILALETTDIGNNKDGSFYRTLHMGAEAKWKVLKLRTGLNQGYWTGGLGVDLFVFSLNFATYGEELGLNPGVFQDRRYALDLGFKI